MITLTPIDRSHLDDVQTYLSAPSMAATSNIPFPYPANGATSWYEKVVGQVAEGRSRVFAMTSQDQLCGVLSVIDIDRHAKSAKLGYWVAEKYQGNGIATNAVQWAVAYAKNSLGLELLLGDCLDANPASARVLERNGFVEYQKQTIADGKFKGEMLRRFRLDLL